MPSIQVTGQLVDPTTGVEGSADIRIASVINYGQTTKKSISHKSTDASGNYDFQLVHGKHLIFVKYEDERIYIPIGYAVVSDSAPDPIDLIQLINLSDENPPSELVTELQQLREDTINDIVDTSAQVLENAGYQGGWVSGTSTALKGETWQVSGRYYIALKDTSVDPINDNDNWREVVNTESVTTAQNDIVGGSIFKGSNGDTVEVGDFVESGITHLRVKIGGEPTVVKISPVASGEVSNLTDVSATIGTTNVIFLSLDSIKPTGWSVYKKISEWIGENPRDTGFEDLQAAISYAELNGGILELKGGTYSGISRLTASDNLTINVTRPTTIVFDGVEDATDLGLFESNQGELKIYGAELTLDANNNQSNGAVISSLQKYIKADNVINVINMPNGSAYFASEVVNTNGTSMSGQGWFKALKTDNVLNGPMVYGTNLWWDENANFESSFELGSDCILKCNGGFAYLFNKLLHVRVGGCLVKDSNGYYKSFSTNFENGEWTASGSTINLNTFTTTTSGGLYTTIPDIEIGQDYFCVFGGETSASGIEIRNGTTGTSPLITTAIGQVAKFTASSKSIYLRNVGAGTTQISDFAVFKFSDVSNNIFQCSSVDVEGTRYIGTRRGPVVGIDCKNFTVRATKTMGATLTGLDIDIESTPGQPQLYPDAYGLVYGNLCKYVGLRGLYSTARRLDVISNVFYYASETSESTTKACMRFNTRNETESNSNVVLVGNRAVGCGNTPFVSVYRGKVVVGDGNLHDSTSNLPYVTDRSGDSGSDFAAIEFRQQGSGVKILTTSDNIVRAGDKINTVESDVTSVKLPNANFSGCQGFEGKVTRGSNSNSISITTTAGTINGGGSYTWPAEDSVLVFICISDNNDYVVSSF